MRTKKTFLTAFLSIVVIGISIYAGYNTYENYTKINESDLLLANIETFANSDEAWNPYCHSGGSGSNSCSIDGGITIAGYGVSTACSVSCNSGYYACCGIRCTCKKG